MKPSTQTTTFTNDVVNRIFTQTDSLGTIITASDPNGNPLTVTEGPSVLTRTFDTMGRVTSYTDAAGNTIEYEWDKNGNLTEIMYPDNKTVTYTYDEHNRLKTVTDWANRITTYHWDAAGRLTGIDRPNGTTRTNQYTIGDDVARQRGDGAPQACPKGGLNRVPSGRDKPQLERYYERGPGGILQAYARFGYDLDSRIDWRYRLPKPQEMDLPTFTANYDADNRVATWNSQSITHDNDGNMTFGPLPGAANFVSYNFDARNRLTGVGGVTYTYDADGAQQRVDGAPLGVPGAKRRVRRAGALWAIDEQNNRIAKTTVDGTTTYVFDPHGDALPRVLVRERPDESLTFYVYGIGLLYEVDEADNATYYHFDQSGSTIALTNEAGEVTDRVDVARQRGDGAPQACPKGGEGRVPLGRTDPQYSPYGTISHRTGEIDTPFLYAGQFGIQTDPNGLLHMRARYYSPELKRFINADPAGFAGGMNWYAYANNSPLMYVDPDGETPVTAIIGGVIGGIVGAAIAAHNGEDILAGALGGALTGAIVGSGNALIYGALKAGSIGAGKAIGTSALWGGSMSMAGNTFTQGWSNRRAGNSWSSSFAQVSRQQQISSFVAGSAFGGLSGASGFLRYSTMQHSNVIANTVSQQMRSSSAYLIQTQRAPMSVVHRVQNSYSSGLANAGRSQANNLFRMSFGVETFGAGVSAASGWK